MTYLSYARLLVITCCGFFWIEVCGRAAETRKLTLPEAVQIALRQNRALKAARWKVTEHEQKKAGVRSDYFPHIKNHSSILHTTSEQNIEIPTGAFGILSAAGPVPNRDILINQGGRTLTASGTSLTQPLTPLIRIRQANRIASSEVAVSRAELRKAENEVALQVHGCYYGILIAQLQKRAAEAESASARIHLRESEENLRSGSVLKVSLIEARTRLLESEQHVLTSRLREADLVTELNELMGLPLDTDLELSPVSRASLELPKREDAIERAQAENPQIQAAAETLEQAKAAVTAAKSTWIPDIALFARHSYQNGVPFLVHNFGTFGVGLTYDVFDFGKRRATVREREARVAQATTNLERLREAVNTQVERTSNKIEQTKNLIQVAAEVVALREESERLSRNQLAQGVVLISSQRKASAASYKAQADLLQAELAYLMARAELEQITGRTPGQ